MLLPQFCFALPTAESFYGQLGIGLVRRFLSLLYEFGFGLAWFGLAPSALAFPLDLPSILSGSLKWKTKFWDSV